MGYSVYFSNFKALVYVHALCGAYIISWKKTDIECCGVGLKEHVRHLKFVYRAFVFFLPGPKTCHFSINFKTFF
jgi:hypothetical protein